MGAHRSSLREDSQVSSAALSLDIINGKGMYSVLLELSIRYVHRRPHPCDKRSNERHMVGSVNFSRAAWRHCAC